MEGRGQHRVLWYRFDYHDSVEGAAGRYRDVAIVHSLPTVWFVDPFEKNRLIVNDTVDADGYSSPRFAFESQVGSDVDLESVEALSQPVEHVLVGRVQCPDPTQSGSGPVARTLVEVGVKVHARYAAVSRATPGLLSSSPTSFPFSWLLSDTARVHFDPFTVVVRLPTGQCRRVVPRLERALETTLPAGAARHVTVVRWVSFAALVVAVLSVIYV